MMMAALGIALAAWPASAGGIRGTVLLSPEAASASRRNDRHALVHAQQGVTDAVIYLEHVPDNVERRLTGHHWFLPYRNPPMAIIVQSQMHFIPRVLPITAGSSIRFENEDRVYHNAFSVSAAKRFDLGKHPPGRVDTVTFERTGVVNLHCEIHPEMVGYVVVVPNHAFTRPDSLGAFELPKLPAGQYVLHAWHPLSGEVTARVEMPKHGDAGVQLTF